MKKGVLSVESVFFVAKWQRKSRDLSLLFIDGMKDAVDDTAQYMTEAGLEIPEGFFVSGTISAKNFREAFVEELGAQMEKIRNMVEGFNASLVVIDYFTGVCAAAYCKELSSEVGFRGILKKNWYICSDCGCAPCGRIHWDSGNSQLAIGFYIAIEALSILENIGNMGIPLPQELLDVLKQLRKEKDS